jgi:hypothetical protein
MANKTLAKLVVLTIILNLIEINETGNFRKFLLSFLSRIND